eukprot:2566259-Pyramimonas_sp.AAC.1
MSLMCILMTRGYLTVVLKAGGSAHRVHVACLTSGYRRRDAAPTLAILSLHGGLLQEAGLGYLRQSR